jgi:hypothetical protein
MLKRVFGGVLRLGVLYLLLPLLLIDLILIQTAVPRLLFQWQPFVVAALIWLAIFSAAAYRRRSRTPLIWGFVSLAYAGAFFASLTYTVFIADRGFTGIPLLIAFAFLAGAINFLYRNRFSEPFLILLPTCAAAWVFIVLLYQPCLVAFAVWLAGKQSVLQVLMEIFGDVTTNGVMLAIVVLPAAAMYAMGKHLYLGAYAWTIGKLRSRPGGEGRP